jgi:hypothetical protein
MGHNGPRYARCGHELRQVCLSASLTLNGMATLNGTPALGLVDFRSTSMVRRARPLRASTMLTLRSTNIGHEDGASPFMGLGRGTPGHLQCLWPPPPELRRRLRAAGKHRAATTMFAPHRALTELVVAAGAGGPASAPLVCWRLTAACAAHERSPRATKRASGGERQQRPEPRRRRAVIDRAGARVRDLLSVAPRRRSRGAVRHLARPCARRSARTSA